MSTLCPICSSKTVLFDSLDFNKSCEEINGKYLPYSSQLINYYICENCEFCFAPEFFEWTKKDFEEKIYNKDYILVDPEYAGIRSKRNANLLIKLLKNLEKDIQHLDYGGGNGLLSKILNEYGIASTAYDPYSINNQSLPRKYNLITAFEVFEHVNDIDLLFDNLNNLLSDHGCIVFSTALNDDHLRNNDNLSTWWYAAPRNGHISLFSKKSLEIVASKYNLKFQSIHYLGIHILYKTKQPSFLNIDYQTEENSTFNRKINILNNYISKIAQNYNSIIVYGLGITTKIIVALYPDKIKLIVDNNKSLHNTKFNNIDVKSPEELKLYDYDLIIIAVLGREDEIKKYLTKDIKMNSLHISTFKMSYMLSSVDNYIFSKQLNSFYNYIDSLFFNKNNIVLYGFSIIAKIIASCFPDKIKLILDNNRDIQNTKFNNININKPEYLNDRFDYDLIFISVIGREKVIRNYLIDQFHVSAALIEYLLISQTSAFIEKELNLRLLKHRANMKLNFDVYPYKISNRTTKIHLIFFMGIGDFLYTTPVWEKIKKLFSNIELIAYVSKQMDIMNNPLVYDLINNNPLFSRVYSFNGKLGKTWEEYDFSDVGQYINKQDNELICPVVFKHTDINSNHRVDEILKAFSLQGDSKRTPLPLLYIAKKDYFKSLNISDFINNQNKRVIFLHLETRSTNYNYNDDEQLIKELISKNYFIIYIKKDSYFSFSKDSFYNLNIGNFNLPESIAFIDSIKIEKYFIATNSLMFPISSSLNIPMLALFILRDSTQTRQVFYNNMRVVTIDKNCYEYLPSGYCTLVPTKDVQIFNGNLVGYSTKTIVESFLNFFK